MSEEPKRRIYIDVREPKGIMDKFTNLGYEVVAIQLTEAMNLKGDYYYNCDKGEIQVERKTVSDWDSSMIDHSLFGQAQELSVWAREKENRQVYIKIIGDTSIDNVHADISYRGRVGAISRIMSGYGIPVTPYSTENSFVWAIDKLIRCLEEEKVGLYRPLDLLKYQNPGISLKSDDPLQIFTNVMRCFGASQAQARRIVENLVIESVNDLITVDEGDMQSLKGIGAVTAFKIISRMGIKFDD